MLLLFCLWSHFPLMQLLTTLAIFWNTSNMLAICFPCIFLYSFDIVQFKFSQMGNQGRREIAIVKYLCYLFAFQLLLIYLYFFFFASSISTFICVCLFLFPNYLFVPFLGCLLFSSQCLEHIELLATYNLFWLEAPVMKFSRLQLSFQLLKLCQMTELHVEQKGQLRSWLNIFSAVLVATCLHCFEYWSQSKVVNFAISDSMLQSIISLPLSSFLQFSVHHCFIVFFSFSLVVYFG